MQPGSTYYVYVIFRLNGIPCYVGKGKGRRAEHHARFSHNKHLKAIYKLANGSLPLVKVRENLTDSQSCAIEIALISAIGRIDLGTGPLVNFTSGGEGLSGHIKSAETIAKLRKKRPPFTDEHLKNMSLSMLGKKRSASSCAKQSATMTGMKRGPSPRRGIPNPAVSAAQLGRKSPETSKRLLGNTYGLGKNLGKNNQKPRKLTEKDVLEIRHRALNKENHAAIAHDYGIHKSQISLIHNRKTWAWL